jgi:endonuclease/exonuclease/phosphatase (EEP) superfamily protein YafD
MSLAMAYRAFSAWPVIRRFCLYYAAGSLLAALPFSLYLIDLASHYRLQYALAGPVLAVAALISDRRSRLAWVCLALGLALNVAPVAALAASAPASAEAGADFRIATVNLYKYNRRTQPLLDWLAAERPEVVYFSEYERDWPGRLSGLADYPYRLEGWSMAFFSRRPFIEAEMLRPRPGCTREVLRVTTEEGVVLYGVHPKSPASLERFRDREECLAQLGGILAAETRPVAVLGDFNTSPYSPGFRAFLKSSGLEMGGGLVPSWPIYLPRLLRIPIDHVIPGRGLVLDRVGTGPDIGSDHLPVIAEARISGG